MDLEERLQGIGGWLSLKEAVVLERLARDQVVMEIGSYIGRSTVVMAEVAKKVICIDWFRVKAGECTRDETGRITPPAQKPDTRAVFERNVKPWQHKIEVHEMNSLDAVKLNWEPVGLLFVDGGHDYATVLSDCGFLKWVVVGGHAAFHDMAWKSVKQAVTEVTLGNPQWARTEKLHNLVIYQRKSENG